MKKHLFIGLLISIQILNLNGQNSGTQKLLQEDLRYWFPIAVKQEVLLQTLAEGGKEYLVLPKNTHFKKPSTGEILPADTVIVVQLSKDPKVLFPSIFYYMNEGYCSGILYTDLFENLPKWQNVLKFSETIEPNHFVNQKIIHFVVSLSPKDGLIDIQIDVAF